MEVPQIPPPPLPAPKVSQSPRCSTPVISLEESHPEPQLVLEHIPHMVVQCNIGGNAVFANSKWIEYTGLSLEDTRSHWLDVVHPQDVEVARSAYKKCLKEFKFSIDYRFRRAIDGEFRWHRVYCSPYTSDGIMSLVFTITDIHIEKTVVQAHQESIGREEIFHRRVRQASDPIITIDASDHSILSFNRAAEKAFQYTQQEIIGRKFTILMDEGAAERHIGPNGYLAQYQRMARKGHQLAVGNSRQLLVKRKDGGSVPITLMVDMYVNKYGQQVYIAVLAVVSHEINLQQELHKSKDTFLSTMSHELRTPLFGLLGMMSMMRLPVDEEARRELRQMEACTMSLLSIVNNMIDFYKLENLAVTPLYVPFQPRVILAEVCAHSHSLIPGGVEFSQNVSETVPQVLLTDPNFIKHIISNLLSNALRFTNQGRVSVNLTLADASTMKAHELVEVQHGQAVLQILISDTGIGIEPDFYPKVFRPFSQMDNSDSRQYGGVGLGLAISKCLVELLGGVISFKSSVGIGSEFKVLLPADVIEAPQCPDRNGSPSYPVPSTLSPRGASLQASLTAKYRSSPLQSPAISPRSTPSSPSCILLNSQNSFQPCPVSSIPLPSSNSISPSITPPVSAPHTPSISPTNACIPPFPAFPPSPTQLHDRTCPVRKSLFPSSPLSTHPSTPHSQLTAVPNLPSLNPLPFSDPSHTSLPETEADTESSPTLSTVSNSSSSSLSLSSPSISSTPHHDEKSILKIASTPNHPTVVIPTLKLPSPRIIISPASSPLSRSPASSPKLSRIAKHSPILARCIPSPSPAHSPAPSPIPSPLSIHRGRSQSSPFPATTAITPPPPLINSSSTPSSSSSSSSMPVPVPKKPHPVLRLKVLVVEDNVINQNVIKKMLTLMECDVVVAKHGREALDILFDSARPSFVGYSKFQLVLMDCQMPVLDGYQTTHHIRNWEREHSETMQHIRVIALTASSSSENEKQCYRAGMDGFISKPITLHGLYHHIADE